MGQCFPGKDSSPAVHADVEADGNTCCDENTCPSTCCIIVIKRNASKLGADCVQSTT